jgi:hypothetical protein
MKLVDFKDNIQPKILDRGRDYYQEGRVSYPITPCENEYIFTIEGSDYYEVYIQLSHEGDILDSGCDCPYDYGPICKHQAAAFFELEKFVKVNAKKGKPLKQDLDEILQTVSKDELIKIIKQHVSQNPKLKQSLVLRYGQIESEQILEDTKKIIKSIVNKYKGRTRFIEYRHSFDFANELEGILEQANSINDKVLAVKVALLLFTETIKSLDFTDDSGGVLGSILRDCIAFIDYTITENHVNEVDDKLFSLILLESNNPVLKEWVEFRVDLIEISLGLIDDNKRRTQLIDYIENLLYELDGESFYKEMLYQVLLKIFKKYDSDNKSLEFIKSNLQFSSFREKLIEKLTEQGDFYEIIKLCLEGERKDEKFLGLISKWKNLRYDAYKNLGLKEEQRNLARELLFKGEFYYYNELKSLFSYEWDNYYSKLIKDLKLEKGWKAEDIFVKIIVLEKDYDELLNYVSEHPMQIEQYAQLLSKKYKYEVVELYLNFLRKISQNSIDRRQYKVVCKSIKKFRKIADEEITNTLISELKEANKRRPAFIDELNKITKQLTAK